MLTPSIENSREALDFKIIYLNFELERWDFSGLPIFSSISSENKINATLFKVGTIYLFIHFFIYSFFILTHLQNICKHDSFIEKSFALFKKN